MCLEVTHKWCLEVTRKSLCLEVTRNHTLQKQGLNFFEKTASLFNRWGTAQLLANLGNAAWILAAGSEAAVAAVLSLRSLEAADEVGPRGRPVGLRALMTKGLKEVPEEVPKYPLIVVGFLGDVFFVGCF